MTSYADRAEGPSKGHLVVTTINPPTAALVSLAQGAQTNRRHFLVIGDRKSPADFALPGADYYDLRRQRETGFQFAKVAPVGHYARKNVGYLLAIRSGAGSILETDDDNFPTPAFWEERPLRQHAPVLEQDGWPNIYSYFTDNPIWPRGLPLSHIRSAQIPIDALQSRDIDCPIQQGLADDNPDVDAIYRLAFPLPIKFEKAPSLITTDRAWSPFNSQNTTWFPQVFPLLYLPFHCSFRMTDIWRSFVAQRIVYANGWGIHYHAPTVYQDRNEHDLMRDFADEVVGYLHNDAIRTRLNDLPLEGRPDALLSDMERCYDALINLGFIGSEERPLLSAWRADIETCLARSE